jgi:hypothetical protein
MPAKVRNPSPHVPLFEGRPPTTSWMEWSRADLTSHEREQLLAALTSEQKAHLLGNDYVWVPGVGVLWNPVDGPLRRSRFTHWAHFATRGGEFAIDAEGSVHRRSMPREGSTLALLE